jgi:hypothetical protein
MKMTNDSSQLPMQTFFINPSSMMNTVPSNPQHGAYVQSYPVNSVMSTEALQTLFLQQQQQQHHHQQQLQHQQTQHQLQQQQQHQKQQQQQNQQLQQLQTQQQLQHQQQQFLNQFQYDPHRMMLPTQFMQHQFSQNIQDLSKNSQNFPSTPNGLIYANDCHNMQLNNPFHLNSYIAQKAIPSSISSFFQYDALKPQQPSNTEIDNKSGGKDVLNMNTGPQTTNVPMQSVTSDGVLLPLVNTSANPKASQYEENPKQQMKQCLSTIEDNLEGPSAASAGNCVQHVIPSSSDYMSSLLENMSEQKPISQNYDEESKSNHYSSHPQPYDNNTHFPELPSWKSASKTEPNRSNASALVVTPILSSSTPPPPSKMPKDKTLARSPISKSTKTTKVIVHKATCGKLAKKKNKSVTQEVFSSPHESLLTILRERKVSLDRIPTQESGYYAEPTPLQLASFGTRILQAVNESDTQTLSALLSCGLSPNPCNSFGDAILSLICKRADNAVFQVFVDHGCDLQVCDSFGRTVLHHLAWAPNFSADMAQTILRRDWTQALMEDKHGRCPLEYVRSSQWAEWRDFLMENKDELLPIGMQSSVPQRMYPRANVADPVFAVSPTLAMQISSGALQPDQVRLMTTTST